MGVLSYFVSQNIFNDFMNTQKIKAGRLFNYIKSKNIGKFNRLNHQNSTFKQNTSLNLDVWIKNLSDISIPDSFAYIFSFVSNFSLLTESKPQYFRTFHFL